HSRPQYVEDRQAFSQALAPLRAVSSNAQDRVLLHKLSDEYTTVRQLDGMIWSSLRSGAHARARALSLGPELLTYGNIGDDAGACHDAATVRDHEQTLQPAAPRTR